MKIATCVLSGFLLVSTSPNMASAGTGVCSFELSYSGVDDRPLSGIPRVSGWGTVACGFDFYTFSIESSGSFGGCYAANLVIDWIDPGDNGLWHVEVAVAPSGVGVAVPSDIPSPVRAGPYFFGMGVVTRLDLGDGCDTTTYASFEGLIPVFAGV